MEILYAGALLLAVALLVLASVAFARSRKISRRIERAALLFAVIILSAGVVAVFVSFPSLSQRTATIHAILHANPADVTTITISPFPDNTEPSLVKTPLTLTDPADIRRIITTLNSAKPLTLEHPATTWCALITLSTPKGSHQFEVIQTSTPENGTIINITSAPPRGWVLGTFRADPLGYQLESLTQREQSRTTNSKP